MSLCPAIFQILSEADNFSEDGSGRRHRKKSARLTRSESPDLRDTQSSRKLEAGNFLATCNPTYLKFCFDFQVGELVQPRDLNPSLVGAL